MAAVNIGQDNQGDAFYRYKMPSLQARIEGRGNGIKTNVVNNVDIAKALERPPEYIIKYFGCELGALTKYDKTTGTSIVNGAHDTGKLKELLEGFIKKYVQCYSCGNPETVVKIRKDFISLKCKACGDSSSVDMRHKLNTFILKNPPEEKVSKAEKKLKKQEKERMADMAAAEKSEKDAKKKSKKGKKKKEASPDESAAGEDGDEDQSDADKDEIVWQTDTSKAAVEKRAAEQLSDAMAGMVTRGNVEAEAEEAAKRADREAAAARKEAEDRKAEEEAAAKEAADKQAADAEEAADPVKRLRSFVASHGADESARELQALEVEGGLAGRMRLLYEALFGDLGSGKLLAAVSDKEAYLKAAGSEPAHQMAHLVALEYLTGNVLTEQVNEVALVLKLFYDSDLVEEGLITAWHDKKSAGKVLGVSPEAAVHVRTAAAPFITWLDEADEDESDEDEE